MSIDVADQTWTPTHELTLTDGSRLLVMVPGRTDKRQTKLAQVARGWTASAWLHPERVADIRLEQADALGINWFQRNAPLPIKSWRTL